ncbi:MAG: acyl carrier protein [Acidobacteriota bacterium]
MPNVTMPDDIAAGVIDFITTELVSHRDDVELSVDDDLLSSGLVDSLGVMRLIRFLEERHGVTVPPADVTLENFMTVGAITVYVRSLGG